MSVDARQAVEGTSLSSLCSSVAGWKALLPHEASLLLNQFVSATDSGRMQELSVVSGMLRQYNMKGRELQHSVGEEVQDTILQKIRRPSSRC